MTTRIVLLCEDDDHDRFVRRFLGHRNFGSRDIFTLPLPDGAQSGEQWVRDSYPLELKKVRRRTNVFLVVVVDADTHTVAGRKSQLDRECDQQDVPRGTPKDPVVVVVPRRAIETWLAWLLGEPVDEETKYPRRSGEECRSAADALHRMCHEEQRLADGAPPSLVEACGEYRKLTR